MTEINCPKCKKGAFHCIAEEKERPLLQWSCAACGYTAIEDEASQRMCPVCHTQNATQLEDSSGKYWWCGNCDSTSA